VEELRVVSEEAWSVGMGVRAEAREDGVGVKKADWSGLEGFYEEIYC
jgi:hypothetical protein